MNKKNTNPFEHTHNVIDQTVKKFLEERELETVKSGFPDLDYCLKGLKGGELTVLAARPFGGQTSFALSVVENVAVMNNHPCLFFCLENSESDVIKRMIQMVGKLDIAPHKPLNEKQKNSLPRIVEKVKRAPLILESAPNPTIGWIYDCAKAYKDRNIRLIVIDSLHMITSTGFPKEHADMHHIIQTLKILARETDCHVIVISQLTHDPNWDNDRRPRLGDLRYHRDIIELSDNVLFLYNPLTFLNLKNLRHGNWELIVAKQKECETGTVKLFFLGKYMKFVAPDKIEEDELNEMEINYFPSNL